jgi:putative MATE family efflux protein
LHNPTPHQEILMSFSSSGPLEAEPRSGSDAAQIASGLSATVDAVVAGSERASITAESAEPPLPARDIVAPTTGGASHSGRETTREIHRAVWQLAWPSVLTMLLQTFNGLLDTLFVGHLPNAAQALAATGVGGQVIFLLISLAMGVSVGTTALVARFTGAKNHEEAIHAAGQSLTLSLLLGSAFGLVFYVSRGAIAGWMLGSSTDLTAQLCSQFLGIALLATVPNFVLNVLVGAFRGLGDTRTPMLIQVVMIATHISCNWLLIYGHLGFPRLGVRGAGTALASSIYVGTALYLFALARYSALGEALRLRNLRPDIAWFRRILRIGIPASVQAVIRTLGMMSFTGLLAHTVEAAAGVAAMNIGIRAEAIAFMPGFGYSVAASSLVGQSLGARDPERAERAALAATGQSILVMALMAALFFCAALPLTALFTGDVLVRHLGTQYLRINAFCEPFLALGMVLTGALQGAGDTVRPTYITLFTMWVVRMPVAWLLMFGLHMQTLGAWYSMTVTTILGGLMTLALFRSGKWKQIRV